MLLKLLPYSPFEVPRTERLNVLESRLRRRADGGTALRHYAEWLEQAGVKMPASRRTLHEDLRRYADFCDDVRYGDDSKVLQLDSRASRDATLWLLGRAWLDSPLRPALSSAVLRCVLLAMSEQAEIHFHYRKLRNPGEPWRPNPHWCVPLRLLPGTDTGYVEVRGDKGGRYPINLSRVSLHMVITEKTLRDYPAAPGGKRARLTIRTDDAQLQERLALQFKGLQKQDRNTLYLELDAGLVRMTWDMLEAHISRTATAERAVPARKRYKNVEMLHELLD